MTPHTLEPRSCTVVILNKVQTKATKRHYSFDPAQMVNNTLAHDEACTILGKVNLVKTCILTKARCKTPQNTRAHLVTVEVFYNLAVVPLGVSHTGLTPFLAHIQSTELITYDEVVANEAQPNRIICLVQTCQRWH